MIQIGTKHKTLSLLPHTYYLLVINWQYKVNKSPYEKYFEGILYQMSHPCFHSFEWPVQKSLTKTPPAYKTTEQHVTQTWSFLAGFSTQEVNPLTKPLICGTRPLKTIVKSPVLDREFT